jgi:threonylcarbamoyladenosine tRNA methylthiotransferase MtaB
VRGRERSIPPENIISEINRHSAEGCREVALTGTQLGSYGFDLSGLNLVRLLDLILAETSVERLRVSSLQAHEITAQLLELWRDSRLMRHFHIPLQSGSDPVLSRMRRRYDTTRFAASVEFVRQMYPEAGITTDVIVGFPGETDDDFADGRGFAATMQFADIHVFPYSPRPGTSAFYFGDQVPEPQKRERMAEMLNLSAESRRRFREGQLETVRPVLWEQSSRAGSWTGLTDNYLRVRTANESDLGNRITNAKLVGLDGDWVVAEVAD